VDEQYNLFIVWAGARSKGVADAMRSWLPRVIQYSKPWMSEIDIEKGTRGFQEISKSLQGIKVGVICLTPENLNNPWLLYETGALSKTLDDQTRVCPLLLGGLKFTDVPYPLAMFQSTSPEKADVRKLLGTINKAVREEPLSENDLNYLLDRTWADLEQALLNLPEVATAPPERTSEDMLEELLELARADANRRKESAWIDQYIPELRQFFPLLSQALKVAQQPKPVPFVYEPLEPPPTDKT
jgi:hypothetical protein